MTYIAYNVGSAPDRVIFSDGMAMGVPGHAFRVKTSSR